MRARLEVTGEESTSPGPVRFDLAEERSPVPMEMAASNGTPGDVEASEVRPTSCSPSGPPVSAETAGSPREMLVGE